MNLARFVALLALAVWVGCWLVAAANISVFL